MDVMKLPDEEILRLLSHEWSPPTEMLHDLLSEALERKLITSWIWHFVRVYFPRDFKNHEDYYQMACLSMVRAIQYYEPGKAPYMTYAACRIKYNFLHHIRNLKRDKYRLNYEAVHLYTPIVVQGKPFTYEELAADDFNLEQEVVGAILLDQICMELSEREEAAFRGGLEGLQQWKIGEPFGIKQGSVASYAKRAKQKARELVGAL